MSKSLSIFKAITVLICISFVTFVNADIWNPAVSNSSFEDPVLASGGQSNDIIDWFDADAYTYTSDDASSDHPETPYGDNWAELGNNRWIYQQIGTYHENMQLEVRFLAGQRTSKPFTSVYITLLVGGNPALAADANTKFDTENPLETRVGAVQIERSQTITPFANTSTGISEQFVTLSTGSGYTAGDPLWIQINKDNNTGRALIDNVVITKASNDPAAVNPTPGDTVTGVDPRTVMSWDAVNTTDPTYKISIGTTPACDEIITGQTTDEQASYAPVQDLLDYMMTYYWRIDVTEDGTEYRGPVWTFTTGGKAVNPIPADGASASRNFDQLSWTGYDYVSTYDVYFGPVGNLKFVGNYSIAMVPFVDLAAVMSSDSLSAGQYQWQVNTLNDSSEIIVEGDVWAVTIPGIEPLYIDDFASYNSTSELLAAWSGGESGAILKLNDLYGALEIGYDNSQSPWDAKASLIFDPPADFSAGEHSILSLSLFGQATNSDKQIHLTVNDDDNLAFILYEGDNSTSTDKWWDWHVKLSDIAAMGVDPSNITKLTINFDKGTLPGGIGTVLLDDIVLLDYDPCQEGNPADFNGDCLVDILDVMELASQWLMADYIVTSIVPSVEPVASYQFEERTGTVVYDTTNDHDADIEMNGVADLWETHGRDSQGSLKLTGDLRLLIPDTVFAGVGDEVTISMWIKMDEQDIEQVELMAGDVPMVDNFWQFANCSATDASSEWTHFAVVINAGADTMEIYCDGVLVAKNVNADIVIAGDSAQATSIQHDTGLGTVIIDDVSIYSAALTHEEIVALTLTSGSVVQPIMPLMTNADIYPDGRINLNDMAIIARAWLQ